MMRAAIQYLLEEARPRWKKILVSDGMVVSLMLVVLAYFLRTDLIHKFEAISISDAAGILINYSAIALGFSVAGLTLVMTVIDQKFAIKLIKKKKQQDPYSDLLFVFSWTSFCHWILLCVSMASAVLFFGRNLSGLSLAEKVFLTVEIFIVIYAVQQFLTTTITISQAGRAYISHLREEHIKS